MRFTSGKSLAASACAFAVLSAVAGCSSSGGNSDAPNKPVANDMSASLVGPGCAAYAKAVPSGAGSVTGMAQDPVATAASNNPLLKTLVAAVSGKLNPKVNLVDTLNGSQFTVFAPVDSAFKALPAATVKSLSDPMNAATLTKILTYHVVPGQIAPSAIDGTHKTVEGATVNVTGFGSSLKVNGAHVICGGVQTANATVYLIAGVLSPPRM
ncbi:MAG: fasciclin domain-containing protein [Nocardioidaceae bacterium]